MYHRDKALYFQRVKTLLLSVLSTKVHKDTWNMHLQSKGTIPVVHSTWNLRDSAKCPLYFLVGESKLLMTALKQSGKWSALLSRFFDKRTVRIASRTFFLTWECVNDLHKIIAQFPAHHDCYAIGVCQWDAGTIESRSRTCSIGCFPLLPFSIRLTLICSLVSPQRICREGP